jgi:RNA polymerase sigma factor (sigma-70 family)
MIGSNRIEAQPAIAAIARPREPFGDGGEFMENVEADPHLSQMTTQWTIVFQAHSGKPDEVSVAVSRLMCRYAGAVHRYLLNVLRDPDAAAELDQEFALRFLRGDFRHCNPQRGRFRDYVKRAVQNLINDYYRRKRPTVSLDAGTPEPAAADSGVAEFEQQFLESWRKDLLDRAWNALAELEKKTGNPYHTVLRSRVDHPEVHFDKLADHLSAKLKRPLTAGAVRQALMRSRRKYVNYLLTEVAASLDHPTHDDLEEELSDLNLLHYCRPYMNRRDDPA